LIGSKREYPRKSQMALDISRRRLGIFRHAPPTCLREIKQGAVGSPDTAKKMAPGYGAKSS